MLPPWTVSRDRKKRERGKEVKHLRGELEILLSIPAGDGGSLGGRRGGNEIKRRRAREKKGLRPFSSLELTPPGDGEEQ